jgi:hypothetical protein
MALGGFRYMSVAITLVVLSHSSIAHGLFFFQAAYFHLLKKVVALAFSRSALFLYHIHISAFLGVDYQ